MGISTFGRSLTLSDDHNNGYKSKAIGPTDEPFGFTGYNKICTMLNEGEWTVNRDDHFKVPYMIKGNEWISYDDVQSIKDKIEFLKSKRLGGVNVWQIDFDDFRGDCDEGSNPLLKTIAYKLNNKSNCDILNDKVDSLLSKT